MTNPLPELRHIPIAEISQFQGLPSLKIRTDDDVKFWKATQGYHDYGLFLKRLGESVVGYSLPWASPSLSNTVEGIMNLLDTIDSWIDEIPPLESPQRFGNLAFRTWGKKLEDEADKLLTNLLPPELSIAVPYIQPYFVTAFGSFGRMDYGTGHETSFALFLLCLSLIRFLTPNAHEERDVVLIAFLRYLRLCWRLQDVYRLEPAGSHGVWGLDDYSFLGYIFGSAQLRDSDVAVSSILQTPLPPTNLYYISINRIREVKTGPFHEHSSQLYSIATGVPRWAKVNSGLFKMYEAEVLGKRVVVQHIPLGGLLEWKEVESDQPVTASKTPAIPVTSAPWAGSSLPPSSANIHIPSTSTTFTGQSHHHPGVNSRGSAFSSRRLGPHHLEASHRPLLSAQVPLGPLASTTLRPTAPYNNKNGDRADGSMGPPLDQSAAPR